MKEWIIILKCGYIYTLRVKGFEFINGVKALKIICAYNKLVHISLDSIRNIHDLRDYVGGSI